MYVYVCVCMRAHEHKACTCHGKCEEVRGWFFPPSLRGLRDQTQVTRLSGKVLYPLCPLAGLLFSFMYTGSRAFMGEQNSLCDMLNTGLILSTKQ